MSEKDYMTIDDSREDALEHYGRKGMKWYQSIYGSKDKKSSGSSKNRPKTPMQQRLEERKKAREKKRSEQAAKRVEKQKQREIKKREEILRNPTKLYKYRNEFTQDEINNALRRFEWEKKLNDYSINQLERGKKYLDAAFNTVNSGINIYNAAARIANTMNKDEKPWPYVPPVRTKKEDKK